MDGSASAECGSHLSEETLEQYAMGRLSQTRQAPVEQHLLLCEVCQSRLEDVDEFLEAFRLVAAEDRDVPADPASGPQGSWSWLRPAALALAAAAAVLVVTFLLPRPTLPGVAPVTVALAATRGPANGPGHTAAAGRPLLLSLDLTGVPQLNFYRVDCVNAAGAAVWSTRAEGRDARLLVRAPAVKSGAYWIRVNDPARGETLREYGLRLD